MRPGTIIDAHHHLWQIARFPYSWLAPEAPPRPFGDHTAIKRDYLPGDYRAAWGPIKVAQTVHVQAECGASDPVAETAWLAEVADTSGMPNAIVFHCDLSAKTATDILNKNAEFPGVRGARAPVSWQPSGRFSFANRPGVMGEAGFLAAAEHLLDLGLVLDIVVLPHQLPEVAELAARLPMLNIVINHLAMAETATETVWRDGIIAIAPHQTVAMKVSGLWTIDKPWRPEILAPFLRHARNALGAERLLWGSNAPVETLNCAIPRQIEVICGLLANASQREVDHIFAETARRLYRL